MGQRDPQYFADPVKVARRLRLKPGCLARVADVADEAVAGTVVRVDSIFWSLQNYRTNIGPTLVAEIQPRWKHTTRRTYKRIPVAHLEALDGAPYHSSRQ